MEIGVAALDTKTTGSVTSERRSRSDGYLVLYTRAAALSRDLTLARADGSLRNLPRLSRADVLVVDDWAMAPMQEAERRDFWEICEERYQTRSTILTSQVHVAQWHEQIGDATIADGILDRLVHNAHHIELRGESMRKRREARNPKPEQKHERQKPKPDKFRGNRSCWRFHRRLCGARGFKRQPLAPHPHPRSQ